MDSTLSALTASTPGTAGLLYTVQGGADRKLSMTAAGAQMLEAVDAAAQITLLNAATLGANTYTALQTITQASANAGIIASTGYSLTGSDATSMIDLAGTWNTSGTPSAFKLNITNTASGSGSKLLDLQFGGVSKFQILTGAASSSSRTYTDIYGNGINDFIRVGFPTAQPSIQFNTNSGGNKITLLGDNSGSGGAGEIRLTSDSILCWSSSTSFANAAVTVLAREADYTLRLGTNAAGVADQTFKACDRITSDGVGANLTIAGGRNRGASNGGSVIIQTSPAAGAGVTGTLTTRVTVNADGVTTFAKPAVLPSYTVAGLPATAADGAVQGAHAFVTDATAPTYLGALTGGGAVVCPVFYNGSAWVSH